MVSECALAALVRVAVGLGLGAFALELEPGELGLDPGDPLLAARLVAFGRGGVVADDEALRCVAVADVDFLDAQVLADGAVAARARQRRARAASVSGIPERSFMPAM